MSISIHPSVDLLQSTDNVRHIYVFYCLRFVLIHLANVLHVSSHVSKPKNRKKQDKIRTNMRALTPKFSYFMTLILNELEVCAEVNKKQSNSFQFTGTNCQLSKQTNRTSNLNPTLAIISNFTAETPKKNPPESAASIGMVTS